MKKIIVWILVLAVLMGFAGCGKSLHADGCKIIHEEDDYVTYQIVCDHCGYYFADPRTDRVKDKLFYTLVCTRCDELMYIRLERR